MMKRLTFLALFVVGCALERAAAPRAERPHATEQASASASSVLVILLDDARADMVDRQTMPNLYSWVADSGVVFTHGIANTSLCCPSRASLYSGKDQHNTRVWDNLYATGVGNFDFSNTVFTTATNSHVTGLFGKSFNDNAGLGLPFAYPGVDEQHVPTSLFQSPKYKPAYYGYELQERTWQAGASAPIQRVWYASGVQNYESYVLARKLVQFIRSVSAPNVERPFVAFLTPIAPHSPAKADPQDVGKCNNRPPFRPLGWNQKGTNQPAIITTAPAFSVAKVDAYYRATCETLVSADRMIDSVMLALQAAGRLDDTYVILLSDNGYHLGDLGLALRKASPYHGSAYVPMMIRGPGIAPRVDNTHFAQMIDWRPTIEQLIGLPQTPGLAGRSLVPLLSGALVGGYDEALLESLITIRGPAWEVEHYSALRTFTNLYIEFKNGDRALYDLVADPGEMANLADVPAYASTRAALAARLAALGVR